MNTRRLVKSGNSSLVVSLPKDWIEKNNLHNKDEIFLFEQDNTLVIHNEYKQKSTEKKEKLAKEFTEIASQITNIPKDAFVVFIKEKKRLMFYFLSTPRVRCIRV